MLSYLKRYGAIPLDCEPLNDVDLLVFAQLAYMDFDGAAPGSPLSSALAHAVFARSGDPSEERFAFQLKDDRQLASLAASCPRYEGVRFAAFRRRLEAERECQFAALALHMPDGTLLIAFRGTDNTLAGWKEDFNMAFMEQVPAQRAALGFVLEHAASAHRLILTGHSKGGNLALYAAACCSPAVQEKIACAVSFDGPGLHPHIIQSDGFRRIESRMRAILPRASLVGLLFEQPASVRIVDSRVFSVLQHYPYFWKTCGMDFIDAGQTFNGALLGGAVRGMLERLSPETGARFVEAAYEIVSSAEADTFGSLLSRWYKSAAVIAARFFRSDPDTRRLFYRVLTAFLSAAAEALGLPVPPGRGDTEE